MPLHHAQPLVPATLVDSGGISDVASLIRAGISYDAIEAQVRARRWQRLGRAIVLHNSELTVWQQRRAALANLSARSLLTSFTSIEELGLQRWERPEIHVLVPSGTRRPRQRNVVIHTVRDWTRVGAPGQGRLHRLAPSLVVAASSFRSVRSATGIVAAAVQQRLIRPTEIRSAILAAPRTRHRRELLLALGDIAQGADALSEIDLARICARFGLPLPTRQAVRVDNSGRRRYLDAEWVLDDRRVVAVEVDGAHHLDVSTWRADQLRQNDIVLGGTIVLRFPSVVVRDQPELVAAQLRRALAPIY
jgi:hypothetical protein